MTHHFNECIRDKVYNTCKDLCSSVNLNSIQETYPKISIYNKIIAQFEKEANLKYGLDLTFTKFEAPQVDLWAKTFQGTGHDEDQQLSKQLAPLL